MSNSSIKEINEKYENLTNLLLSEKDSSFVNTLLEDINETFNFMIAKINKSLKENEMKKQKNEFEFDDFWQDNYMTLPKKINDTLEKAKKIQKETGFFPLKEMAEHIFGFSSKKANKITNDLFFNNKKDLIWSTYS